MELTRLMELATGLIVRVARHRARWASGPEIEDAASETRIQVLTSLQRLRHGNNLLPTIADFEAYVGTVATKTCAQSSDSATRSARGWSTDCSIY